MKRRLSRTEYRFVEKLLYDYKAFGSAILQLENETASLTERMTDSDNDIKAGASIITLEKKDSRSIFDTSKPEKYTIERDIERKQIERRLKKIRYRLQDLKRWQTGISEARSGLSHMESQFIWLKYDKEKSNISTRLALQKITGSMSESTYFRFKRRVIEKVGKFLGLGEIG